MLVESLTGRKVGNLNKVKEKIDQVVDRASLGGEVTTSIDEDGLKVQFSNALLFNSGEAKLTNKAQDVFAPISDHLVHELESQYGVTIEGYTDDVPIENGKFQSNWELSTSRAINVMERLAQEGFDRRRMSVQGFADTRSATDVDLHDDEDVQTLSDERLSEVRAKNRRVVLRINTLDREVLREIYNGEIPGNEGGEQDKPAASGGAFGGMGGAGSKPSETSGEGADASESGLSFPGNEDGGR
jgi:flagellar motor protein MotB